MARIYSYVVRYDSGFAPNPFYGYCTLATCKPDIRRGAEVGDWVVGSGSNDRSIRRGGHLVYAISTANLRIRHPKGWWRTGEWPFPPTTFQSPSPMASVSPSEMRRYDAGMG